MSSLFRQSDIVISNKILDFYRQETFNDFSGNFLVSTNVNDTSYTLTDGLSIELKHTFEDAIVGLVIKKSADMTLTLGNVEIFLGDSFLITYDSVDYNIDEYISQEDFILAFDFSDSNLTIYQNGRRLEVIEDVTPSISSVVFNESALQIKHLIICEDDYRKVTRYLSDLYIITTVLPDTVRSVLHVPNGVDIDILRTWLDENDVDIELIGFTDVTELTNDSNINLITQDFGIALSEDSYSEPIVFRDIDLSGYNITDVVYIDSNNYYKFLNGAIALFLEFAPSNEVISKAIRILQDYNTYPVYVFVHSLIDDNGAVINEDSIYNSAQYF